MRKIALAFVIACGVIVAAYGIYFILGRPPIPLPVYKYPVSQGNRLYDYIKETESDRLTITWATNGEIEALADGESLVGTKYDMKSLGITADLAKDYTSELPENIQNLIFKIDGLPPPLRTMLKMVGEFFYYVVRLKITLVILAK